MFIVVGLGNPGREYERTRHNAGYMTADALASSLGAAFSRRGFRSVYAEARIGAERVVIVKPETFMNASGFAVSEVMNWFKVDHDRLIVIYDDIDLPVGALRIRANGSAGTHNGMRSIDEQLGYEDFPRIRVGIGRPEHGLVDHVLGVPNDEDAAKLREAVKTAAEAVKLIVRGHIDEAQTRYNYKPPKKEKAPRASAMARQLDYRPTADRSEYLSALTSAKELFFQNGELLPAGEALKLLPYSMADVLDAEARLERFAPLIKKLFPETEKANGLIESPLSEAPALRKALQSYSGGRTGGRLFVKLDSDLPIAGSVKARGGIYEVLKHAEALALENGLITPESDYSVLADARELFSRYTVQVGSTGNLGLSIGVSASALGFRTVVHMSADAKEWKKALLRSRGVEVVEYDSDYSAAVREGRALSDADPMSYFVDDENSLDLFMGYAVAALRLKKQLSEAGATVDAEHPLFVYLPCGVGGAPGGITFGLKLVYGDSVRCYFAEPVNAPCMLAAFIKGACVHISELGLSGKTDADGLAVGAASRLVFDTVRHLTDGGFTVDDARLAPLVKLIHSTEKRFIEPSAAAAAAAYLGMLASGSAPDGASHVLWATGGALVPDEERQKYLKQ